MEPAELTQNVVDEVRHLIGSHSLWTGGVLELLTKEVTLLLGQCFLASGSRVFLIGPEEWMPADLVMLPVYPSHLSHAYCQLPDGRVKFRMPEAPWVTMGIDMEALLLPLEDSQTVAVMDDVTELAGVDLDACLFSFIAGVQKAFAQPSILIRCVGDTEFSELFTPEELAEYLKTHKDELDPIVSPPISTRIIKQLCKYVLLPLCEQFLLREEQALSCFQQLQSGEPLPIKRPTELLPTAVRIERAFYRHQAEFTYGPLLTVLGLSTRPQAISLQYANALSDNRRRQLLSDIDEGRSFLGNLAKELNVPGWVLRHIIKLDRDSVLAYTQRHDTDIVADLSRLQPANAPTNRSEVECMSRLLHELPARMPLVRQALLDRQYSSEDLRAFKWLLEDNNFNFFKNYLHFINAIYEQIKSANTPVSTMTPEALMGNPHLAEWVMLCKRWCNVYRDLLNHPDEVTKSATAHESLIWPALLSEPVTIDGVTFRSLSSYDALNKAGVILMNCLGNHFINCLHGAASILALEREGVIFAAAELDVHNLQGHPRFSVNQASGTGNRDLPDELEKLLHQLVVRLNNQEIPINPAFLDADWMPPLRQKLEQALYGVADEDLGVNDDDLWIPLPTLWRRVNHIPDIFHPAKAEDFRKCLEISPGRGQLYQVVLELVNRAAP